MQEDMLVDSIEHLLAGCAPPNVVRAIEAGGSCAAVWQAIEDSGFCDALVPEGQGGAGLGLSDVFAIFEACGRHALPLPLAQTMCARAVLAHAGIAAPKGSIALTTLSRSGIASVLVSYGMVADWVLVESAGTIALLDARLARRLAIDQHSPDAQLTWPVGIESIELAPNSAIQLRCLEACLLAAQMSGAMRNVLALSLKYANERSQFGRSIGKFQVIQQQLSVMAEQAEAARMAARMACATGGFVPDALACAMAKARTSEAAITVAAIAHAVHGAIGITEEYDLQLLTRRLLAWRIAAGSESYWNQRIGRALVSSPHATLPDFVRHELAAMPLAGTF